MAKSRKKKNNKKHGRRRLLTRFGIDLNDQEYQDLIKRIQNHEFEVVESLSKNRTKFDVTIKGHEMFVIYDSKYKTILTALYKDGPGEFFDKV